MPTYNILVILPHNPGDVIMGLHLVSRIKAAKSDAEIYYLAASESVCFVRNHPDIAGVFELPSGAVKKSWKADRPGEMFEIISEFTNLFKGLKFDLSVNLFQENFGALIHSFICSKKKIGYDFEGNTHYRIRNRYMCHLFAVPVKRSDNPWHMVDIFLRALSLQSAERPVIKLPPTPEIKHLVPETVKKNSFVFQLGSAWRGKCWPVKAWAELAGLLCEDARHILVTGAPEEARLFGEFLAALPGDYREKAQKQIVNLVGKTNLLETFAVIQKAGWVITGDTVSMHLGAAAGTKTLALFGASNPVETGPYGNGHFVLRVNNEVRENLSLAEPDSGLESIQPIDVAGFIRKGLLPQSCEIWETCWNPDWQMQVLRGPKQNLHPFQIHAPKLEKALGLGETEDPVSSGLPMAAEAIERQLKICLEEPGKENLLRLEALDREFSGKTRENIIWEAYRININGLSLTPIESYLKKRIYALRHASREAMESGLQAAPRDS